jgi:hypothetical protein
VEEGQLLRPVRRVVGRVDVQHHPLAPGLELLEPLLLEIPEQAAAINLALPTATDRGSLR